MQNFQQENPGRGVDCRGRNWKLIQRLRRCPVVEIKEEEESAESAEMVTERRFWCCDWDCSSILSSKWNPNRSGIIMKPTSLSFFLPVPFISPNYPTHTRTCMHIYSHLNISFPHYGTFLNITTQKHLLNEDTQTQLKATVQQLSNL